MTKEQYLSVFEAYIVREFGVSQKTAKQYSSYLVRFSVGADGVDYLQRIAQSGVPCNQMHYAHEIWNNIVAMASPASISDYRAAVSRLEMFIERPPEGCDWPRFAPDSSRLKKVIKYDDETVSPSEQVDGLSIALKNEYIRVIRFAKYVLDDQFAEKDYALIPVILTKKEPVPVQYKVSEAFRNKLRELAERQDLAEDAWGAMNTGIIWVRPVAQFSLDGEGKPQIEIYYANTTAGSFEAYLAKLKNWLAHEYMHYLHYRYCERIGDWDTWKNADLAESMADFFGMAFTLYRDGSADWNVAMRRYIYWAQWFDSGLPYANALRFYKANGEESYYSERFDDLVEHKNIQKLNRVLQKCEAAYSAMMG